MKETAATSVGVIPFQQGTKRQWVKFLACLLTFLYTFNQIQWAYGYETLSPAASEQNQKTVSLDDVIPAAADTLAQQASSQDFLSQTLTLKPVASEDVLSPSVILSPEDEALAPRSPALNRIPLNVPSSRRDEESEILRVAQDDKVSSLSYIYDYERYEFEDALDLLRPEYASAAIVKDLKKEDLQKLLELEFEVGILALHGEIILFTSGNKSEIRVLDPVQQLIAKADLIAHTHPDHSADNRPSSEDLMMAVESPAEEYVISHEGVYGYSRAAQAEQIRSLSAAEYLNRLLQAVERERENTVPARAELNQFIAAMDAFNAAPDTERLFFRAQENPLAPQVVFLTESIVHSRNYEIAYTVDGQEQRETVVLQPGLNTIHREFQNQHGTTLKDFQLEYQPVLENGTVLAYRNGKLVKIEHEGLVIEDLVISASNTFESGVVNFPNGREMEVEDGKVTVVTETDGSRREYANGYLAEYARDEELTLLFSRVFDGNGKVTQLTVQEGTAQEVPTPPVQTPAQQVSESSQALEVGSNGNVSAIYQGVRFTQETAVSDLSFWMSRYGNPSGKMIARIYENTNGQPGVLVASSQTRNASELQTGAYVHSGGNWFQFHFGSMVELEANKDYFIAFELVMNEYTTYGDGANYIRAYRNESGDPYTQGQAYRKYAGNHQWLSGDWDFKVEGYNGGIPGPVSTAYSVNASGQLVNGSGQTITSPFVPYSEGYTKVTTPVLQSEKEGQSIAALFDAAVLYEDNAPVQGPWISLTSDPVVHESQVELVYTVDGHEHRETVALLPGLNTFHREFQNPQGTTASRDFQLDYKPVLGDGTILTYRNQIITEIEKQGLRIKDITVSSNALESGTVVFPDGREMEIEDGDVAAVIETDGSRREYLNGYLAEYARDEELTLLFSRVFDGNGKVTQLTVQEGTSEEVPTPPVQTPAQQVTDSSQMLEVGSNGNVPGIFQGVRFTQKTAVSSLSFWMNRYQNPSGKIIARIYENTNGQPGTLVASSLKRNASDLLSSSTYPHANAAWFKFNFENMVELDANKDYFIAMEIVSGEYNTYGDGANYIRAFRAENGDPYTGGQAYRKLGSNFQSLTGDWDFKVEGYNGGIPGPVSTVYSVNASGQLVNGSGQTITSPFVPYAEGYTKVTTPVLQSEKEGQSIAALLAHVISYENAPAPPQIALLSAVLTKNSTYTLRYESAGEVYEENKTLTEGANTFALTMEDDFGRTAEAEVTITLDSIAPAITLLSSVESAFSHYILRYQVDGQLHEEAVDLTQGVNTFTREFTDAAGNTGEKDFQITYNLTFEALGDSYDSAGHLLYLRDAGGTRIEYAQTAPYSLLIRNQAGVVTETIQASYIKRNFSDALKVTLQNGIDVFYEEGEMAGMRLLDGTQVQDAEMDAEGNIQKALIIYPNGTTEVIRFGKLLRRIQADGTIMDFTPAGQAVREILEEEILHYEYQNISQEGFDSLTIRSSSGAYSVYDNKGILREASDSSKHYVYDRTPVSGGFTTALNAGLSSAAEDETMIAASYNNQGELQEMTLENGTRVFFEDGRIVSALDAENEEVDYAYLESSDFFQGLRVTRGTTQFQYSGNGFLESVVTDAGTIRRTAEDINEDGQITSDEIKLLLESVGGETLTDFELDEDGNILHGIITTKEGIKQKIENGVLTGFETVDGKIYDFADNQAVLKEWNFRDGTRVLYGGGTIQEILFPEGRKLNTIGRGIDGKVNAFVEEAADGSRKFFENGRLVKFTTEEGTEILYDLRGLAKQVTLPDETVQVVSYAYASNGDISEIIFTSGNEKRVYSSGGNLLDIFTGGVRAEIEEDEIQKIFTRFGDIETPSFDAQNRMSGEVLFEDGTRQIIEDGKLARTIRPSGTQLFYTEGQISKIQTATHIYKVQYTQTQSGDMTGATIKVGENAGDPEFSLVPYLLDIQDYTVQVYPPQAEQPYALNGNASVTESAAKIGQKSVKLDGSGDYVQLNASSDWNFGTGDFTMATWFRLEGDYNDSNFLWSSVSGPSDWTRVNLNTADNRFEVTLCGGGCAEYHFPYTVPVAQWTHFAVTRQNGVVRVFANGNQIGSSISNAGNITAPGAIRFGAKHSGGEGLDGWMDGIIVEKGRAAWTSSFTPPAAIERTANTVLSLNFDPIEPPAGANTLVSDAAELSSILLPKTLENTFKDRFQILSKLSSSTPVEGFHFRGDAHAVTTETTSGASLVLDGSGDYLDIDDKADWDLSGDYTMDTWFKLQTDANRTEFLWSSTGGPSDWTRATLNTADNRLELTTCQSGSCVENHFAFTSVPGVWTHLAIVRQAGVIKVYVNGQQKGSAVSNSMNITAANKIRIGAKHDGSSPFAGGIDGFRITKGTALWSGTFTPPVSYEGVSAQLLLDFPSASKISSILGVEQSDEVAIAQLVQDEERGTVFEFETSFMPEWNMGAVATDAGYITQHQTLDIWDNLPSKTADFVDMNGDGLKDRIYVDPTSNFWWVQINNGLEFAAPVKWEGVDRTFTVISPYSLVPGTVRFYEGRHPQVLGDLIDINEDGLPDRVMQKFDGSQNWYVQYNNGHGFDPVELWAENAHVLSQFSTQARYAMEVREDTAGHATQEMIADFFDLDGDGLPDRVVRPKVAPFTHWFFQKNTGDGFADAMLWQGVDNSFHSDASIGGSLSWYNDDTGTGIWADLSAVYDLNGDKRPDRILLKPENPANIHSAQDWYVQINNGSGFDAPVLWDSNVRTVTGAPTGRIGTSLYAFFTSESSRRVVASLVDVTGDGLIDRVTMDNTGTAPVTSWWVEVNTGETFAPAVEWKGIEGNTVQLTAIAQDGDHFRSVGTGREPSYVNQVTDLQDINGDNIPDRLLFPSSGDLWKVQLGTGSGFLPAREMKIESLSTETENVRTDLYDYLHVSLRADQAITSAQGTIKVVLGSAEEPASYQEWEIDTLNTDWRDVYLKLDPEKEIADRVRIFMEKTDENLNVPVFLDNVTFASFRPEASKDWLDRFLAEENTLAGVNEAAGQSMAQYLGLKDAMEAPDFDWDQVFQAPSIIDYDQEGETESFQDLYGTVSQLENGQITQTQFSDGRIIEFEAPSAQNPQTTQQTVTQNGVTSTQTLSYGRVRTVTREEGSPLQYSYEFDASGQEITAVLDPDTGVTERYRNFNILGETKQLLISRTEVNGITTQYTYTQLGELTKSEIVYKGRVRQSFAHGVSKNGNAIVTTEEGTTEEYDSEGNILFHTTAEGYRYKHDFGTAKQAVTSTQTESIELADGTMLDVVEPVVELVDCIANCEEIHRVMLDSYTAETGEYAEYEAGVLKSLKLNAQHLQSATLSPESAALIGGMGISFDEITTQSQMNSETGLEEIQTTLRAATVMHEDGSITEFRDGEPYSVTSAAGRVINLEKEDGLFINSTESAVFHYEQARKLWTEVILTKWNEFQLSNSLSVHMEYDMEGALLVRQYAEGITEVYEDGHIQQVIAKDHERLITYDYDEDDNIIQIDMEGSRRRLNTAVIKLRAEVSLENEKAMANIADRNQVLNQTIEGEYVAIREKLLLKRRELEDKKMEVGGISIKGKVGREIIGNAMSQIQGGIDQINQALDTLARQRQEALEQLSQQVAQASADIEVQTEDAYRGINNEEVTAKQGLSKQELIPVINHWYREIMGREASDEDFAIWLPVIEEEVIEEATANEEAKVRFYLTNTDFSVEDLKDYLLNSQEYQERLAEVNAIKAAVKNEIDQYLGLSEAGKLLFAESLGIPGADLPSSAGGQTLNASEAEAIKTWLDSQTLHFGQSAFLSLEALLQNEGISYNRVELAVNLILIDILTGTLTVMEQGDLILSFYAMKTYASTLGLDLHAMKMSYDALKAAVLESQNTDPETRIVVHIDERHYVIVTGISQLTDENGNIIEEVTYIDPSAGREDNLQQFTITKEAFLEKWLTSKAVFTNPENNTAVQAGYVLSVRGPPEEYAAQTRALTVTEQMQVRGAFFGLIVFAVIAIAQAVVAAVAAVVAAIVSLIAGIVAGIGAVLSGIGSFFGGILGSFVSAFQGVFTGILNGLIQIGTAFINAAQAFTTAFVNATGLSGTAFGNAITGTGLAGKFVTGLVVGLELQGLGYALQGLGVSPKIAGTITAVAGVLTGTAAFTSSALLGSIGTAGALGFIGSGTADLLSLHTNLSPTLSSIIGIGSSALGAFTAGGFGLGGSFSLEAGLAMLKEATPYLAQSFAATGVTSIGNALGLDPRLSSLISIPVSAAAGAFTGRFTADVGGFYTDAAGNVQQIIVSNPNNTGWTFVESVRNALFDSEFIGGAISLGASFISEQLNINPLITSLGLRGLVGGIEGLTDFDSTANGGSKFIFGVTGALKDSLTNVLTLGGANLSSAQRAAYVSNLVSFQLQRGDLDIFDLFELHANQILGRDTTESIIRTGQNIGDYFKAKRTANDFIEKTDENGNTVHEYTVGSNTYILNEEETVLLKRQFGDHFESGEFAYDSTRKTWVLKNGAAIYQTSTETVEYTIRNGQVTEINIARSSGESFNVIGTAGLPLKVNALPGGRFEIIDGVARNWQSDETRYFVGGQVAGVQQNSWVDFQTAAVTGPVAGSVQFLELFNPEGQSIGYHIYADEYLGERIRSGDTQVAGSLWETIGEKATLQADDISWIEKIQLTQLDLANQGDAAIDKVMNYLRPAFEGIEFLLPHINADATEFVLETVSKGLVDTIRIGTDLDDIFDETGHLATNWKDMANDERLLSLLSIGSKTLNEGLRFADLFGASALLTTGIDALAQGGGKFLVSERGFLRIASESIAERISRLLKSTNAEDVLELQKLFRNPAVKDHFLNGAKNIDDVASAFKKGYLNAGNISNFRLVRTAEDVNAAHLIRKPTDSKPWVGNVEELVTTQDQQFVRVFKEKFPGDKSPQEWIVKKNVIEGKSPAQIKDILSIPGNPPTHVVDVNIPAEVSLRKGTAAKIDNVGNGGAEQFEIVSEINSDWYSNPREIENL